MSSPSSSPPITPSSPTFHTHPDPDSIETLPLPSTPPPASGLTVKITLPTPPSFAAHRAKSYTTNSPTAPQAQAAEQRQSTSAVKDPNTNSDCDSDSNTDPNLKSSSDTNRNLPDRHRKKGHKRSVSFNADVEIKLTSPTDRRSSTGGVDVELEDRNEAGEHEVLLPAPEVDEQDVYGHGTSAGDQGNRPVYKIPQRQPDAPNEFLLNSASSLNSHITSTSNVSDGSTSLSSPALSSSPNPSSTRFRGAPPSALTLNYSSLKSPFSLAPVPPAPPKTAPNLSRFSASATSTGLRNTISQSLTKAPGGAGRKTFNRHSFSLEQKPSIWSRGLGPGTALGAGWITPGLSSAKSVGSVSGAARQRGLMVAVLKEGKEMLVESTPVTPGLPLAAPKSPLLKPELNAASVSPSPEARDARDDNAENPSRSSESKPREIILCRYYHTPGLTCTSRPCRFVHNLDTILPALKSPNSPNSNSNAGGGVSVSATSKDVSKYRMLSPTPRTTPNTGNGNLGGDYTSGVFAKAQKSVRRRSLNLQGDQEVTITDVVPGETVVVAGSAEGEEAIGTVFLMSGGGKGAAGKSKSKYKTVPCKDFAEGHCPYGEYCSFIHANKSDQNVLPEVEKADSAGEVAANDTACTETENNAEHKSEDAESGCKFDTKAGNKSTIKLAQSLKFDKKALEHQRNGLSAFAPPFLSKPLQVDQKGQLKEAVLSPRLLNVPSVTGDSAITTSTEGIEGKKPKPSAWAKGPPKSLKPIKIIEPEPEAPVQHDAPISSSGNLLPPVSAYIIHTESDPATPWDPAVRTQRSMEMRMRPSSLADIPDGDVDGVGGDNYTNTQISQSMDMNSDSQDYHYDFDTASQSQISETQSSVMYPTMNFFAPTYPWGMPMSPLPLPGTGHAQTQGPNSGSGVLWTPAGWAVQDAAMKRVLNSVEARSQGRDVKLIQGKHYYRKRPCIFFAEGHCPHGDECTYLHESPGDSAQLQRNTSKRAVKPHLPCKFFNSATGCHNGTLCTFLHTLVVPENVPLVDKLRAWRTRPCRHFQLGRCTLGETCGFAHVIDPAYAPIEHEPSQGDLEGSTVECYDYTHGGRCRKGNKCRFMHLGGTQSRKEGVEEKEEDHSLTEDRLRELREITRQSDGDKGEESDGDKGEESDGEDEDDVEIVTVNNSPPRKTVPA